MSFVSNDGGASVSNRVLANLPADDFRVLRPHLQRIEIKPRSVLQEANRPVEHVHFIEHGLVSRVSGGRACSMETAMVGRFGYTGVAVVLGSALASQRSIVRLPGTALRIRADRLSRIMQDRPQIRAEMLRYVQSLITQNTQSVLCAAKHEVDQRLARWLLLASDRMQSNALTVTHDLLAVIMGVRRAGVTKALLQFEADGVLKKTRGAVHLTNRSALEQRACDCYGIVRDAYACLEFAASAGLMDPCRPGSAGNPGRTAGAALGLTACSRRRRPLLEKLEKTSGGVSMRMIHACRDGPLSRRDDRNLPDAKQSEIHRSSQDRRWRHGSVRRDHGCRSRESTLPQTDQLCFDKAGCALEMRDSRSRATQRLEPATRSWKCEVVRKNTYGRLLARCSADGEDIALQMVRDGWALASTTGSHEIPADEEEARAPRRACGQGPLSRHGTGGGTMARKNLRQGEGRRRVPPPVAHLRVRRFASVAELRHQGQRQLERKMHISQA